MEFIPRLLAFTKKIKPQCRHGKYTSPMEHLDLELFFVFVCPIYPEKDGKLRQIPNVPNRSEALQRSGSPLVVPENVLEAQSGWKC